MYHFFIVCIVCPSNPDKGKHSHDKFLDIQKTNERPYTVSNLCILNLNSSHRERSFSRALLIDWSENFLLIQLICRSTFYPLDKKNKQTLFIDIRFLKSRERSKDFLTPTPTHSLICHPHTHTYKTHLKLSYQNHHYHNIHLVHFRKWTWYQCAQSWIMIVIIYMYLKCQTSTHSHKHQWADRLTSLIVHIHVVYVNHK